MSNAARKNRKHFRRTHNALVNAVVALHPEHAESVTLVPPFQHPVKTVTPIVERAENLPQYTRDEPLRAHRTAAGRRRLLSYAELVVAQTPPLGVLPESAEYVTAGTSPASVAQPNLDPQPFLCGKSRFANRARAEASKAGREGATPRFMPRDGYSQDLSDYTTEA